jgi:hypothetical protein
MIKKRLNGMLHNVTSKYRAKLADMSKYNTVVWCQNRRILSLNFTLPSQKG